MDFHKTTQHFYDYHFILRAYLKTLIMISQRFDFYYFVGHVTYYFVEIITIILLKCIFLPSIINQIKLP